MVPKRLTVSPTSAGVAPPVARATVADTARVRVSSAMVAASRCAARRRQKWTKKPSDNSSANVGSFRFDGCDLSFAPASVSRGCSSGELRRCVAAGARHPVS